MRDVFFGYYAPTAEQYRKLWHDGLIVLDTNVLLSLYKLPATARDEILTVLELLKERLWIPHQVALEFQRARLSVIAVERKASESALTATTQLMTDIKTKVDALQIDKRGLGIETKSLLDELDRANRQLLTAIRSTHEAQIDVAASDPIRERLDSLLDGRVGPGPMHQADLDALVKDGEQRYIDKVPPGFADADKEKNPNDATFIFDHLKYQRKFGDLILWRQLLNHASEKKLSKIVFVTFDRKDDWWWREHGKTIGPHPELMREMHRVSGVSLFWMYSSVQFIEHANKYAAAQVSSASVAEVKQMHQATDSGVSGMRLRNEIDISERPDNEPIHFEGNNAAVAKQHVYRWLRQTVGDVTYQIGSFPEFICECDHKLMGFEVKYLRQLERMLGSEIVAGSLLRGYLELNENRLSEFTLIIVVPEQSSYFTDPGNSVESRLRRILDKYPVTSIVIGEVVGGQFVRLFVGYGRTPDEF